ncbi:hypothetical protein FD44_GL001834 [Secundilactobacillus malefermentans DSM 5705 = KCTC 3548]|nr:hypothetical protein FD44_GL001834 [Secundilactobacillus malefermentans DSM 5705 = KCTC 3548]
MLFRGNFIISAGKGYSAIANAAYRSGEKLFDNQEGRHYLVFDQENRFSNGIEHCYYFRNAANDDS